MSTVRLIHEEEVQPAAPRPAAPLPQIYTAIGVAIAGRLHALILLLSAIAVGLIAVVHPDVLRLWAAGGYGVFTLAALAVVSRKG